MALENTENLNTNEEINSTKPSQEPEITLEDLQNQLKEAQAERDRLKTSLTKSNADAADWKRKFRERQSAEEQAADAKREAEALQQEQMESIKKELSILKATNRYLKQNMDEKLAKECAELEADNDMENLMAKINAHYSAVIEEAKKSAKEELLASRPDIKAGNGEDEGEPEDPFVKAFNNPDAY